MNIETLEVSPSAKPGHVVNARGETIKVPDSWTLLKPGDAALSRRIKKEGPSWSMKEKKGRRLISKGIWAPADRIAALRAELMQERLDPSYQKKLDAGRKRREKQQLAYAADFESSVRDYLSFAPAYAALAAAMAKKIADHATPVGSGTVARTKQIPIEQRAEAATIAWMRHQTTAYDDMVIPRVKGRRREVRSLLAKRSKLLLNDYRNGTERPESCPLSTALKTN
ncbi:hypothetical protein AB833_02530 [Chromatiales bacterium (ex Bugula neritina AB1)]|nr:hypothetical protein AB833_02530 [Chromatiales bacterium (ex Bugula neritina AB1)]